jgi:hypothetical protein
MVLQDLKAVSDMSIVLVGHAARFKIGQQGKISAGQKIRVGQNRLARKHHECRAEQPFKICSQGQGVVSKSIFGARLCPQDQPQRVNGLEN